MINYSTFMDIRGLILRLLAAPLAGIVGGLAVCWLLAGCTTVRYLPEYHYRDSVVNNVAWRTDTVYIRDSVCVDRYRVGDTVYRDRSRVRYIYKYVGRGDSLATATAKRDETPAQPSRCGDGAKIAKTVTNMVWGIPLALSVLFFMLWRYGRKG